MSRHDPMAPPIVPPMPLDRADAQMQWAQLHRDVAYLRRVIHRLQKKARQAPQPFGGAPVHAKLWHRPIILGLAPTMYARSHMAWDDPFGDQLAARLGMSGLMHLMGNFKLRNVLTCPLQDLPLAYQATAKKEQALQRMVAAGVFRGRVVIVCGNEVRQLAGLTCDRDYIGPVSHQLGDSTLLISMVEPGKSKVWTTPAGSRAAMREAVRALLAARLPSEDSAADAMRLFAGEDVASWRELGGGTPEQFADLLKQEPREVWHLLVRLGIAAPADLGAGAWYHLGRQQHVACLSGGTARITYDFELRASEGDYIFGELLDRAGVRVYESWSSKPHVVRARLIDEAVRRGWDFAYAALDRRLAEMRGAAPLLVDAVARERIHREAGGS